MMLHVTGSFNVQSNNLRSGQKAPRQPSKSGASSDSNLGAGYAYSRLCQGMQTPILKARKRSTGKSGIEVAFLGGIQRGMEVKRGDIVTVALPGVYGKPRPALVIQSDLFNAHRSVTILPVTSELRDTPLFRVTVIPTMGNGLLKTSQVMVDKIQSIPRNKIGKTLGEIDIATILEVNRALALVLGFA